MRYSALLAVLAVSLIGCRSSADYVQRGNRRLSDRRVNDAAIEFHKAIQKDPRNADAYEGLARAERRRGDRVQALRALMAARDLQPNRADIRTELVQVEMPIYLADPSHPAKLYDDLQKEAGWFLTKNASSYDGLRIRALLAWTDGKLNDALALFQAADHSRPNDADLIASWCQVLFQDGQFEEGERRARDLIRTQPHHGPIYDELAGAYYGRGQRNEALDIIRLKAANNPDRIQDGIQLASWYFGYGDKDKAKEELERILAAFPSVAYVDVGDFWFNHQDWQEAIRVFRKGASLNPRSRVTYLRLLCDAYLAAGNPQGASRELAEILKVNPKDDIARIVNDSLTINSGPSGKTAGALADMADVVRRNPDKPVWRLIYASARMNAGDPDGSAHEFEEVLKAKPDLLQAKIALAQIAQQKGEYRKALQYADEIVSSRPGLPEARFLRAAGLIGTGQYNVARAELADLAQEFPNNPEVGFQLASLDLAESKYDSAETRLQKLATDKGNRMRALQGLVNVYAASNRLDKAYGLFAEESAREPDSEPIRAAAAELALRAGKYDESLRLYQELTQKYPNSAVYRRLLGATYQVKGDMPSAIASYQRAAELGPKDPAALGALADALRITGRQMDAIATYRRLLAVAPGNATAMNNLAYLLADSGANLDEATALVENAIGRVPDSGPFQDTLGLIYIRKNQGQNGVQILQPLAKTYPNNAEIRYHFAMALKETGRQKEARDELQAALHGNASTQLRREILASLEKVH